MPRARNTLARAPAVSFLLRAWQLPVDGWEFAPVASVLRSTYFRPDWPEVRDDPEIPAKAEALLRMLGETRGRDSFLRAAAAWENLPPEPLEDEQPEEPLRQRKQRLARRCRPFLERFFRTWDDFELEKSAAATVADLKSLADEIGLSRADTNDLVRPGASLGRARPLGTGRGYDQRAGNAHSRAVRPSSVRGRCRPVPSADRHATAEWPCSPPSVPWGSSATTCSWSASEKGAGPTWPHLSRFSTTLSAADSAGPVLALSDPEARLGREQLLFDTLIAAPRRELVLSYAAVDGKGQDLLPCSFLREYLDRIPHQVLNAATDASRWVLRAGADE